MRIFAAVAALVGGVLLLVIPRFIFPACEYLGRGRMHCTDAAHGEFVVGGLLVAAGAALLLLQAGSAVDRRRGVRGPALRRGRLRPGLHPLLRQPRHGVPLRDGAERPVHRRRRRDRGGCGAGRARARVHAEGRMIELKGLSKTYTVSREPVHAVQTLDLAIPDGQFVSIVGHSGSGKSTLLSLIGGLARPDTGSVTIDGVDIWGFDDRSRSRLRNEKFGFIYQFASLMPTLTAAENVLLPTVFGSACARAPRRCACSSGSGSATRRAATPRSSPGGEQQRVAIARAFINGPRIVLADEPTGELDEETESSIMDLLAADQPRRRRHDHHGDAQHGAGGAGRARLRMKPAPSKKSVSPGRLGGLFRPGRVADRVACAAHHECRLRARSSLPCRDGKIRSPATRADRQRTRKDDSRRGIALASLGNGPVLRENVRGQRGPS